MMIVNR